MIRRVTKTGRSILLVLSAVVLVSGCAAPSRPLQVWTNVAEVAFVVEHYNAVHDARVEVSFVENLVEALTQEVTSADVVIGRWVNTPTVNRFMTHRDSYATTGLGENDSRQERTRIVLSVPASLLEEQNEWIPVSFNLPAVAYLHGLIVPPDDNRITLPEMSEAMPADGPPVSFVPAASTETTYALNRALGLSVAADETGNPILDATTLEAASRAVASWREIEGRSAADERAYAARYLNGTPVQLLRTGRIGFWYFSTRDLFSWTFFSRNDIGFRWLASDDGAVAVTDDVVYAGIPQSSEQRTGAVRFLDWIMSPQTQAMIAREKIRERVDSFGFLEGLSTIPEVNRVIAGEIHSQLAGRIPHPTAVTFPNVLPRYWNEALEEVVGPMLADEADAPAIESAIRRWYNQRGD